MFECVTGALGGEVFVCTLSLDVHNLRCCGGRLHGVLTSSLIRCRETGTWEPPEDLGQTVSPG